jgi:uncharacterized membrane protein YgdD (TMEM256/DUF423 family)
MKLNAAAWGGFFALTSVVLGALGSHALKKVLPPESLVSFETGVRYQMYHALALILFAVVHTYRPLKHYKIICILMISGVFLFSLSIYLLATQSISNTNLTFLGPVTPVGGLLLIGSWILFTINVIKK